jgi:DNA-binding transcriptional regulator YiaG
MKKKTGKKKENRFTGLAQEIKDWKAGKVKFRTTIREKDGTRTIWEESGPESKARKTRLAQFKAIRADLGLTQAEMAAALHVAKKTVQGWEIGKPIPDTAFILAELIHDVPAVRKRLLVA